MQFGAWFFDDVLRRGTVNVVKRADVTAIDADDYEGDYSSGEEGEN